MHTTSGDSAVFSVFSVPAVAGAVRHMPVLIEGSPS